MDKKISVWLNDNNANEAAVRRKSRMPLAAFVLVAPLLAALALLTSVTIAVAASNEETGDSTFKSTCAMCHGPDGSGNTPVGMSMRIPDLHSTQVQSQSDTQLAEAIGNGKNSMPPFKGSLSPAQIHDLVVHLRQLSEKK